MYFMPNGQFSPLWDELIKTGRTIERERDGVAHSMTDEQLDELISTIDYHLPGGVENPMGLLKMVDYDMRFARYRLYDVTGMIMGGRWGDELTEWGNSVAKAYIGCVKEDKVKTRSELYDCVNKRMWE